MSVRVIEHKEPRGVGGSCHCHLKEVYQVATTEPLFVSSLKENLSMLRKAPPAFSLKGVPEQSGETLRCDLLNMIYPTFPLGTATLFDVLKTCWKARCKCMHCTYRVFQNGRREKGESPLSNPPASGCDCCHIGVDGTRTMVRRVNLRGIQVSRVCIRHIGICHVGS